VEYEKTNGSKNQEGMADEGALDVKKIAEGLNRVRGKNG
jgi:hypothetical protein